ncbi:hypothetical protein [Blastopirellula retiformator]|uniref:Uncharacterized protein n=1 Tax=Blastopirellula retiformator TaxID=2527970 RepID=A0A5C5V5P2_9BACT|nr:hypothetical protein [Blastopirellula retiformator]TWT33249.1 hypothetical protein Enr8_30740 [Blastopirellula retiformator]
MKTTMREGNNFPQLVEVASQLPDFPWEAELAVLFEPGYEGPFPSDEKIEAAAVQQSPAYLADHAGLLAVARQLLKKRCENWVPETAETWQAESGGRFQSVRQLSRVFAWSAHHAERTGDLSLAVKEIEYGFLLATANRKGGLIVDYLVSAGIEGVGLNALRKMRRKLSLETQRSLPDYLDAYEKSREPYDVIYERDRQWELENGVEEEEWDENWLKQEEFADLTKEERDEIAAQVEAHRQRFAQLTPEEQSQARRNSFAGADLRSLAMLRLLRIELALLVYQAEQGSLPNHLDQLTPNYLASVPPDPHGGGDYRYRGQGKGYLLYGLNEHQIDCGGKRGGLLSVHGGAADFFLDYLDFSDEPQPTNFFSRMLSRIRSGWRSLVHA